jgi:hypothetical protein
MPATFDQTTPFNHVGTGTSCTFTFGTNPVSGSTIFVHLWSWNSGTPTSVTDNATGNTYTIDASINVGTNPSCWLYRCTYVNLPASGALAITVTFGSAQYIMGGATSFLNAFATPTLGSMARTSGIWTTSVSATVGVNTDCLFIAVMATDGTTAGNGIATSSPAIQLCSEQNSAAYEGGVASYLSADSPQSITWTCTAGLGTANTIDMIIVYDTAPCIPRPVQTQTPSMNLGAPF